MLANACGEIAGDSDIDRPAIAVRRHVAPATLPFAIRWAKEDKEGEQVNPGATVGRDVSYMASAAYRLHSSFTLSDRFARLPFSRSRLSFGGVSRPPCMCHSRRFEP